MHCHCSHAVMTQTVRGRNSGVWIFIKAVSGLSKPAIFNPLRETCQDCWCKGTGIGWVRDLRNCREKKRGLNLVCSGERKGCDWVRHQEESEICWVNGPGLGTWWTEEYLLAQASHQYLFFILSSSEQFARLLVPISMKGYAFWTAL